MRLIAILEAKNSLEKKIEIKAYLEGFLSMGRPNYSEVLKVPSNERILAMNTHLGIMRTIKILSIPISACLKAAGIDNKDLEVNICSQIIDECHEDNLSLQDLFIFAKGYIAGKYAGGSGVTQYGKITQISFMDKFELYRQERHQAMINARYEESAQYKGFGPSERESDNNVDERKIMAGDVLKYHYEKHINDEKINEK